MRHSLRIVLSTLMFFLALVTISPAWAFEAFPEFVSITEQEYTSFDRPDLLGPEYQGDLLNFDKLPDWEYYWLSKDKVFDTTVGSIDSVFFATNTRLKLKHRAKDWFEIGINYFDDRNHEYQQMHLAPELNFWILPQLAIGAFGEYSYLKRENDIGGQVIFKPIENHSIKAFFNFVDVTRQKRSDRTDTFTKLPYAMGAVGRAAWPNRDFLEYSIRYETPTTWRFPDEYYEYRYARLTASAWFNKELADSIRLNNEWQWDRKFEAKDRTSAAAATSLRAGAWTTVRVSAKEQVFFESLGPSHRWALAPGVYYAFRDWSTPNDTLTYHDILPHLIWKASIGEGAVAESSYWLIEYDLMIHRKSGGAVIGHPSDKSAVNHRLNTAFTFAFGMQSELRLAFGWDLDAFFTSDTWEAGNAEFRFYF